MAMKTDRLDAIEHDNLERGGPFDPFPMQEADIRWLIAVARAAVKMQNAAQPIAVTAHTAPNYRMVPVESVDEFERVWNGEGRA